MNKSKIEWTDYTWNVVTGCLHGCNYCYARRQVNRFGRPMEAVMFENALPKEDRLFEINEKDAKYPYPFGFLPTFHRYRLDEPAKLKKPAKIFVSSMGDLFGEWVPKLWIKKIIEVTKQCPQHTFLFLTKNPDRYFAFNFPDNCWLGASAVNKPDEKVVFSKDRKSALVTTAHCVADTMRFFPRSFLSIEPLLNDVAADIDLDGIDWIIVGGLTGPGAVKPKPEWVQNIIDQCRAAGVPVFMKNNLKPIWQGELIQEFPEGLKGKRG